MSARIRRRLLATAVREVADILEFVAKDPVVRGTAPTAVGAKRSSSGKEVPGVGVEQGEEQEIHLGPRLSACSRPTPLVVLRTRGSAARLYSGGPCFPGTTMGGE